MTTQASGSVEPFYTLKEIAALTNLKYWLVLRCANDGLFPTYTVGNKRKRALLSEVLTAIRGAQ
jgi:hypothetical protein